MAERSSRARASAQPGVAFAEGGVVVLEGPQGAIATLTPEAAVATSESLRCAARDAVRQRSEGGKLVPLRPDDEKEAP
jgi:hypothetical protein